MISRALLVAVGVQLACQTYKVLATSVRTRSVAWRAFFSAGGMPSAHSAFVSALVTMVGRHSGPASDVFGIAAVLATIVIYDSLRLRGVVQANRVAVRRLQELLPEERRFDLAAEIGHSPQEVVAGILAGVGLAMVTDLLLWPGAV